MSSVQRSRGNLGAILSQWNQDAQYERLKLSLCAGFPYRKGGTGPGGQETDPDPSYEGHGCPAAEKNHPQGSSERRWDHAFASSTYSTNCQVGKPIRLIHSLSGTSLPRHLLLG